MDELISRQAAIDYFVINVGFHDEDGYPIEDTDELRKIWTEYFDGIPSAQPEPHWIPATEESIPDGEYLVTWNSDIQEKPIISIICRYSEVWDCWELQLLGHHDINILAYMPLPEPYKGGRNE